MLAVRSRTLPDDHTDLATARGNLALTLKALGDLHGARALQEQVLAVRSHTLPDDHTDLATARGNLAATLHALGDLHGARALLEQVLAVFSRTLPDDHPDLVTARGNLATTLFHLGDLHGARALFEQMLAVYSQSLPDDHPDLATARANLAATLQALGDLHGARALEEQVLAVRSRTLPDDHPDLATARGNLATTLFHLGDLHGARVLFEQVLAVCSRTLPDDHPDLAAARVNLAAMLHALGDLHGARALEEHVLAVRSRTLPDDHPDLGLARLNLAETIRELGDLHGARALLEQVLAARSTLPDDHPYLARARGNLAMTLKALGDLHGARALEEQVLAVRSRTLPDDHPDLASARSNLAGTLADLGDLRGARALNEQVLAVRSRTLPDDHPDLAAARSNLAVTLRSLGDLHGARVLQEQVLAGFSRTLPEEHPDLATARGNLAATLADLGDLRGARALLEAVLAARSRTLPDDHPDLATTRHHLARTWALQRTREGEGEEGVAFRALSGEITRGLAKSVRASWVAGSTREIEERLTRAAGRVGFALSLAEGLGVFPPDEEVLRSAFVASESARGGALVAARLANTARGHSAYADLRSRFATAAAEVADLSHGKGERAALDAAIGRRDAAEQALLRLAVEAGAGEFLARELDVSALAAMLEAGSAALTFRRSTDHRVDAAGFKHTDEFVAFVLHSDGRLERVDLGAASAIEQAVADLHASIGSHGGRGRRAEDHGPRPSGGGGERVRELVFDPVRPALGDATDLVVVLDDVLHSIPFDALPLDGTVLGERFRIEHRLTLLERMWNEPGAEGGTLVACGGVDYGGSTPAAVASASLLRGGAWEDGFSPLDATAIEARGIATLFEAVSAEKAERIVLERTDASRDAVAALAPNARFLHLATHGWFAPESIRSTADPDVIDEALGVLRESTEDRIRGASPMVLCGLALAGANLPPDEIGRLPGLVTAEEIAGWDLSNCELAVLSACDTNVGLHRAGQGVASLQKALHMAGARSVITSLWKVPDEATKELMLDFYRRLWVEGKPKRQALWEAKMRIRDAKDETGAPKYATRDWAAWVLTGEAN